MNCELGFKRDNLANRGHSTQRVLGWPHKWPGSRLPSSTRCAGEATPPGAGILLSRPSRFIIFSFCFLFISADNSSNTVIVSMTWKHDNQWKHDKSKPDFAFPVHNNRGCRSRHPASLFLFSLPLAVARSVLRTPQRPPSLTPFWWGISLLFLAQSNPRAPNFRVCPLLSHGAQRAAMAAIEKQDPRAALFERGAWAAAAWLLCSGDFFRYCRLFWRFPLFFYRH